MEVSSCYEMNWSTLSNRDLLKVAEQYFEIFVTTDKNIRYQQNIKGRKIAIFVLPTTQWPVLCVYASIIAEAIANIEAG